MFFFLKKSYHSNLAITFYVDHEWPNGFKRRIDQARNCPFRLSDDRWRHVRLRNRLLDNRQNCKTCTLFFGKGMSQEMVVIPPSSSQVCVLWTRLAVLTILSPQFVLEKIFRQNLAIFNDLFAYFGPQPFLRKHHQQFSMPSPYNEHLWTILSYSDNLKTQPFFVRECASWSIFWKIKIFVIMDS